MVLRRCESDPPYEASPRSLVKPGYPANSNKNIRKVVILISKSCGIILAWPQRRNIHNIDREGCHLNRLGGTSIRVVNLLTSLTALVRPGEVSDGNDEEGVAGVGNTGKGIVPGGESSDDTESTSSSEKGNVSVVEV
jgi:hypothetical protein